MGKPAPLAAAEALALGLYQALFGLILLPLAAAAPWLVRIPGRVREGFHSYFGGLPRPADRRPLIWVHAVSLGESLVACAVMKELKTLLPGYAIGFTTTHPQVLETVRKKGLADVTALFPLDFLPLMMRALKTWRPALALVVETDFWPAFSLLCRWRGVPLVLVNGRISARLAGFYSAWKSLGSLIFQSFSRFLVISKMDCTFLKKMSIPDDRVIHTGNIKLDLPPALTSPRLEDLRRWQGSSRVVVFGSIHPSELDVLEPVMLALARRPGVKCLVAPRNLVVVPAMAERLTRAGAVVVRRTSLSGPVPQDALLLLDTFGELGSAYSLATVAFVGGTIDAGVGGHNPLEPLHFGVPVVVGPHCRNFLEVIDELTALGAVVVSAESDRILAVMTEFLADPIRRQTVKTDVERFFREHAGALGQTLAGIRALLA